MYVAPFHTSLWICVFLTLMLLLIVSKGLAKAEKHGQAQQPCHVVINEEEEDDDVVLWTIAATCAQSWDGTRNYVPFQVMQWTTLAVGVILTAAYTAVITAVLAIELSPIGSFDDLLAYKYDLYAHERSTFVQDLLRVCVELTNGYDGTHLSCSRSENLNRKASSLFMALLKISYLRIQIMRLILSLGAERHCCRSTVTFTLLHTT